MPLENQQNFAKGTVSTEASRLSVNYTSKLTVQIVLGVMVVFGLAALLLVDLKRTLPRSPHSIASVMALFAGSKLCSDVIPEGAEWFDKQQLDRLFGGYMFALGWWSSSATEAELRSIDSLMIAPLVEKRYGIDIGTPERFGFSMRGDRDKI
ncbi:hypothetical protein P280DRAFT_454580 [Massarina eburnea CBS 473.64]|uniref:Uncharacterized protein n=1 Tax=Massarina eburnea CBS 473.64 TaxID=1395130 RepID=A0A6A6RY23_9PLEO|nr:hypothetical protein P280DRAFT_454580 [Massarina eburnea CBS 473.64]